MLPPMALPRMSWMLLSCLMLLSQVQDTPQGQFPTPITLTWPDANLACQKRSDGSLASVLSGAEASFLASLVKNNLNNCNYVWIGLHDPTEGLEPNADGWEWSNKDVMNYFAWEKVPASIPTSGHCGSLSRNSGYLFWKDYNCNEKLPYVCKFKA
ncbi:PREDICTED: regenerating islet-derived protein 3-alpha [Myotis davidii]|uniref:regenerating islet-derived protein 3-alpha n=1 Tax=Myotis davidii TaxID=225400 RepID=UPI000767847B|nr:PREDICTED: regenerating islet-derived protein 3-alpha [Myotis davidii]